SAICDLGASDKLIGQSIGNKGIGFRSVLQVADWPEIYSANPDMIGAEQFDGFCFGFARTKDILRLVGNDQEKCDHICKHISPYFMPIPLSEQNSTVREFARDGFASVVRLPLKSDVALREAAHRFRELELSEAPALLFLDRISTLTLELVESIDVC